MADLPTLGAPQKKPSPVPGVTVAAVVVGLISGGVYWWRHRPAEAPAPAVAAAPGPEQPAEAPASGEAATARTPVQPRPAVAAPGPTEAPKLQAFTITINGALETSIVAATDKDVGLPLTQVVKRALVWWVRVPQDLERGDRLSVVYEARPGQEPAVHAVRFTSGKLGKTVEAYRFHAPGSAHARFYQPDGSTLEEQLVNGPLTDYEQITSLLRDGRHHQGVDFKTAVGTPVHATFDGVITRRNWNFRGNGNSLEIQESGGKGRVAMFLHLSELPRTAQPGARVRLGQVIAQSGNSGHSFAPHLHYQLMRAGRVIDPFDSHSTRRSAVPADTRPAFKREVERLEALIPGAGAVGG